MSLSRRRALTSAAVAALAAGGWSMTAAASSATELSAVERELLDAMRGLHAAPGGPPALIAAFGNRARIVGVADVLRRRPPHATDHTRLASVAKAFSGATALALVARRQLSLDDTVGARLAGLPAAWSPVTLSQLLGHTSGIPDFSKEERFQTALRASLQNPPPHRTLLSYIEDPALGFTPGSRYEYSNTDNIIVALMCEAAAHGSYEDLLRRYVLGPLRLSRTSLPNGSAMPSPFVHGYDVSETPPQDLSTVVAAGWSWASGGIVSTPADTVQFIRGYVRGDTTNGAARRAQFQFRPGSSEPPGPGTNSAGLALFRYDTKYGTVFGHTGNTAGYTQFTAATGDGRNAVAVTASAQITPTVNAHLFPQLRTIFELAVGAALTSANPRSRPPSHS